MVKYAREPAVPGKAAKACGKDIRIHFKNTFEAANAIKGMQLERAQKYMQNVIDHKQCVPFKRYNRGIGRNAQTHQFKVTKGRTPDWFINTIIYRKMAGKIMPAYIGITAKCEI